MNPLKDLILKKIHAAGGKIPFSDYMALALYTKALGYYMRPTHPFGKSGDFITAPEISPLFGQCLYDSFKEANLSQIVEFGAGTGKLAKSLLEQGNIQHYRIIELNPSLREVQKEILAAYLPKITWHETVPKNFEGIIIANEIIDAFPATKFHWKDQIVYEYYVTAPDNVLTFCLDKPQSLLLEAFVKNLNLPDNYTSEVHLSVKPWLRQLSQALKKGAIYLIDYGFPQHEFYHPERHQGTLMCHLQHNVHENPLLFPGEQDITAHVNFSLLAEIADEAGLNVSGYTSQEAFLLACNITQKAKTFEEQQAVKLLIHPAEMGELFKVMLLTRNIDGPFHGFTLQDRRNRL
jgi:SAM-dependent MidA family methyltransferase